MITLARWSCTILLAFAALAPLRADERILDFRSDIVVAGDGSMTVTESIRVRAEGQRIRHGIFRDFPTDYRDRYGNRVRVEFEPLSATRDGAGEIWRSEHVSNGVRVYLGSADSELAPGEYDWQIRYRTTRQLGFFADHDELYWNATGNGWDFPIDHAAATVTLPDAVAPDRITVSAYTGAQGATGHAYRASADAASHASFETTRPLGVREGLTIVVEFPKGVVAPPSSQQQLRWLLADNVHIIIGCTGLLLVALFLAAVWWRLGRDPRGGPIFPLYEAPPGYTPAELRFIERMGYDDRCFAADLVDLGVHGAIEIRQGAEHYTLRRLASPRGDVPALERGLFDSLLGDSNELVMEQAQHTIIGGARDAHRKRIESARGTGYFSTNGGSLAVAALLALATIQLVDYSTGIFPIRDGNGNFFSFGALLAVSIFAAVFAGIGVGIGVSVWRRWSTLGFARGLGGMASDGFKMLGAVILCAIGALIGLPAGAFGVALALALLVVIWIGAVLLPAPTPDGRKLLDRIGGLRLYLGVAERDSLARQQAPQMTQEEFERFLPYALAFDVEKTWCDRFATVVGPAAAAAAMTAMTWYRGDGASFGGFASSFGSSLSSTISSSSSAPGSSSGGGGGGSSGGGGGGGGGGGW